MEEHFFDEEQLLDLVNDNVKKKEDADNMKLEAIYVTRWEKKNGL